MIRPLNIVFAALCHTAYPGMYGGHDWPDTDDWYLDAAGERVWWK